MFLAIPRYAVLQYPNCSFTIRNGCSTLHLTEDFWCSMAFSQSNILKIKNIQKTSDRIQDRIEKRHTESYNCQFFAEFFTAPADGLRGPQARLKKG